MACDDSLTSFNSPDPHTHIFYKVDSQQYIGIKKSSRSNSTRERDGLHFVTDINILLNLITILYVVSDRVLLNSRVVRHRRVYT